MSDKKQLNEKQLEKVSGGASYAPDTYLPASHGSHLRADELYDNKSLYIGQKMYCVRDRFYSYYAVVTLVDIYKSTNVYYYHEKIKIESIGPNGFYRQWGEGVSVGSTYDISAIDYTMYALEPGYEASL